MLWLSDVLVGLRWFNDGFWIPMMDSAGAMTHLGLWRKKLAWCLPLHTHRTQKLIDIHIQTYANTHRHKKKKHINIFCNM